MRLKSAAVATAVGALMALAACGGGDSNSGSPSAGQSSPDISKSGADAGQLLPNETGPAPAVEGSQEGGTITVSYSSAPAADAFDPTENYYQDALAIDSDLIIRSLTQFRFNPKTGQNDLVPDMATNLGTSNKAQTEWTFELRPGLKYENGDPVTADDVAYGVMRSFAKEELPTGPTYNQSYFLDGDTYKGPYKDGTNYKGVKVNGNKITIICRKPFPDMPYYASYPIVSAIPQSADTNPTQYGRHPLSTGPYMFDTYKPGNQLVLVKNPNWDPATDPGRHQFVDKWIFNFGVDTTKEDNELINDTGEAQTSLTYDNILASDYPTAEQAGVIDDGRLVIGTQPCTRLWYLDMRKITDLKVRQAIGWAYPYEAAWKAAGYIKGLTIIPGTTLLPPGTPGRLEFDPLGNKGEITDTAKAKQLLTDANALGYEVKWYYQADVPESVAGMKAVSASLNEAGFKASPIASSSDTIRDDLENPNAPTNVASVGWCSDWPSGSTWFPQVWYGPLIKQNPTSAPNKSYLDDPTVNKKIDTIVAEPLAKSLPAWGELDKYIMENIYPNVVTGYEGTALLRGSKVGGFLGTTDGMPPFANLYITQ